MPCRETPCVLFPNADWQIEVSRGSRKFLRSVRQTDSMNGLGRHAALLSRPATEQR